MPPPQQQQPVAAAPLGPPALDDAEIERLVQTVKDWTIANGLSVRPPPALVAAEADPAGVLATSVAVTLFPSPFPKNCFEQAQAAQKPYNELYAKISQDEDFIRQMVEEVIDGDEFIAKLWGVHLKVKEEGYVQDLSLGLFRSDYMVHQDLTAADSVPQVKQVEFNTIASSFGGLSAQTTSLHKYLAQTEYPLLRDSRPAGSLELPENRSTQELAAGLRAAFEAYSASELGHERCVIFLVQDGERNVFDQRHLEYEVQAGGGNSSGVHIPVFRLPFSQILARTTVAATPRRQLLYSLPSNPER
ncbi:glutathione synthetase large subunit, partial [Magnaporthiopsis poae ATCC 64411]